ncbi:MAG: CpsD/CapB family tyrosine-protein kinase [Prochloron sp. SP5CPC1]|nr:CpsD/CapB family tyrosine-protein kinase [Candidatus Paraprochloron terpiosi SP5CPC1]
MSSYLVTSLGKTKVLAITSTRPSEGKTTITYNLGLVLAEMGHKTLLVDGDMRRSTMHKLTQQANETGLSTAIAQNVSWTELIQQQGDQLDLLTAGPTPPNPVALLGSQRMKQLTEEWRQEYEYVLIDTPPISGSADTLSIATDVDSVLFVAAMERVTRSGIRYTMETLRGSKCNLAGVVVNFVTQAHQDYGYYSDYYYYYHSNGNNINNHNNNGSVQDRALT